MTAPWLPVEELPEAAFAEIRRRAIFDCHKWDPQVGDACVIARHPIVLTGAAWRELVTTAQALAREALAAETELVARPELHAGLGLPRAVRRALRQAASTGGTRGAARLIRFDFHHTPDGWRISEANADVPGGLNEASGFPTLMAPHYPWAAPVGDPAGAYVRALLAACGPEPTVALIHATAYSDDQQMMSFVARRLTAEGARVHLASPAHLRWAQGRASLDAAWYRGPIDLVVRFFPGDWLCALPRSSGWTAQFAGGATPMSNPPASLVIQTKRFPLVWDRLRTPLPTWRGLLPETRDPRDAPWKTNGDWILKPALGRVGEGIGMAGVTSSREWKGIRQGVRWSPQDWIAQRRFETTALDAGGAPLHACVGVYTIDAVVAGAYGRVSARPLIDSLARDAAVLAA